MKETGKIYKDFRGNIIAIEYESEVEKGKTNWIYKSTEKSELEYLQGCTIIAL